MKTIPSRWFDTKFCYNARSSLHYDAASETSSNQATFSLRAHCHNCHSARAHLCRCVAEQSYKNFHFSLLLNSFPANSLMLAFWDLICWKLRAADKFSQILWHFQTNPFHCWENPDEIMWKAFLIGCRDWENKGKRNFTEHTQLNATTLKERIRQKFVLIYIHFHHNIFYIHFHHNISTKSLR